MKGMNLFDVVAERAKTAAHDAPTVQPTGTPPDRVAGGKGIQPAAPGFPPGPTRAPKLSAKDAERLMQAEILGALRNLAETSTALAAAVRGGITNSVLDVFVAILDANGICSRSYPVPVGSVGVINHSATATLTVQSAPESSGPPGLGRGMQLVEPKSFLVLPISGRFYTIYGTAGEKVSVQAFTGLVPWGGGAL
jgi:hypothetical protein